VFAFFGIEAPRRVAEAWLVDAEEKKKMKAEAAGAAGGKAKTVSKEVAAPRGGKTIGALEKKKRRGASGGERPAKRSRLIDTLFSESPLCSKGGLEGEVGRAKTMRRRRRPSRLPSPWFLYARSLPSRYS
jgi:hypothetical protein